MDEQPINLLIIVHATAGGVALLCGPGALISRKGGRAHRTFGKIFFFAMMSTATLALLISVLPEHTNPFLFIIGIFSIYMVSTGYRYISLDNLHKGQKPAFIDWVLTVIMALFGLILFLAGVIQLIGMRTMMYGRSFGIVMVVFAGFSLLMVRQDIDAYKGKVLYKNHWILMHIGRMIGANIAAFTAFLVVNNTVLPNLVAWLLPTAVGVPISYYWRKKQMKVPGMKIEPKN